MNIRGNVFRKLEGKKFFGGSGVEELVIDFMDYS